MTSLVRHYSVAILTTRRAAITADLFELPAIVQLIRLHAMVDMSSKFKPSCIVGVPFEPCVTR